MRRLKTQPQPSETKRLYTIEEARSILMTGKCTMARLLAQGDLQSLVIGRCRRIPAWAIDEFLRRPRDGAA